MKDNKPKVFIGTCVHNKQWVIRQYIENLEALEYPKELISLVMYINDSVDGTREILLDEMFRLKKLHNYGRLEVYEENFGFVDDRLNDIRRGTKTLYGCGNNDFSHFALVRNNHKKLIQDEDYFFSVDCDVLVQPKSLKMLLEDNKDFVALPVNNQQNRNDYPIAEWPKANYNIAIKTDRGLDVWKNFPWNKVFECDITGACVLMKAEIAKKFMYRAHSFGEDAGFCSFIKAYGYGIWVDSRRKYEDANMLNVHCMTQMPKESELL